MRRHTYSLALGTVDALVQAIDISPSLLNPPQAFLVDKFVQIRAIWFLQIWLRLPLACTERYEIFFASQTLESYTALMYEI